MARSRIALLYVGGSIGMKANQKTGRIEPLESLSEIHRFLPELQREVAIEFFSIGVLGSSEIKPHHWTEIAQKIESIYDDFEGFIVVHGTNTMGYTAAALSFALQGLSKPVVMTGALVPINDIAGDGRMNLIFAMRAAQLDIAEVCVVLGPHVWRGNRVKKVDQTMLQTFKTPTMPSLIDFSAEVEMHPWRTVRRKRTLQCRPEFDPSVVLVTANPGMTPEFLDAVLVADPHGIVLRTYGPGMIAADLFPWLQEVAARKIPVVITSQALCAKIDLHRYRKQTSLERLGVISGKNMTYECAMVKLMWALKNTPRRLREVMEKSLVGELDV